MPPPPQPGTPYHPAWYVERPHEQQRALNYLEYGQPVLLWGPRRQGRTWFWTHVAAQWQAGATDGRRVALVSLHTFPTGAFADLDVFLRAFAVALLDAVSDSTGADHDSTVQTLWASLRGDPLRKMKVLLTDTVLRPLPGPLLLIIDRADLLVGRPYYDDFSGLLRSWAEASHRQPWSKLRLLVAVSTHPARLSTEMNQSFFYNLSDPIEVSDLDESQVATLARLHDLALSAPALERVMSLVGGHPYLTRAIFVDLASGRYTLDELASGVPLPRSLAADHLREHRIRLNASPELKQAFAALAQDPRAKVEDKVRDVLIRQGLVRQGEHGALQTRYCLYERLLQTEEKTLTRQGRKLRVFYSYAAKDEALRERLEVHLKLLARQDLIEPWHQRHMLAGSIVRTELDEHLDRADLILLLVSPDFLASDECWGAQMKRALERHEAGSARVVPILMRPCDWMHAPFAKLEPLPRERVPVTRWPDQDDAWANVANSLRTLIAEWPGQKP
jgi:AAA domain-containing protein/TIR domain-containing protein